MKTKLILFGLFILMTSCVQKTHKQFVIVTLDVSKIKAVKWVGIRGNGKPLSWDKDYPMQEVVKDSLYKAAFTTETGYLFTECKFTVNGDFELKDNDTDGFISTKPEQHYTKPNIMTLNNQKRSF